MDGDAICEQGRAAAATRMIGEGICGQRRAAAATATRVDRKKQKLTSDQKEKDEVFPFRFHFIKNWSLGDPAAVRAIYWDHPKASLPANWETRIRPILVKIQKLSLDLHSKPNHHTHPKLLVQLLREGPNVDMWDHPDYYARMIAQFDKEDPSSDLYRHLRVLFHPKTGYPIKPSIAYQANSRCHESDQERVLLQGQLEREFVPPDLTKDGYNAKRLLVRAKSFAKDIAKRYKRVTSGDVSLAVEDCISVAELKMSLNDSFQLLEKCVTEIRERRRKERCRDANTDVITCDKGSCDVESLMSSFATKVNVSREIHYRGGFKDLSAEEIKTISNAYNVSLNAAYNVLDAAGSLSVSTPNRVISLFHEKECQRKEARMITRAQYLEAKLYVARESGLVGGPAGETS